MKKREIEEGAEEAEAEELDTIVVDKATGGVATPLKEVLEKCEGQLPQDWELDPIKGVNWHHNFKEDTWFWSSLPGVV